MANHHAVHVVNEFSEDGQLVSIELFAAASDSRQLVMSIGTRGGISGKMFAAARDPLSSHRFVERARIAHDLIDIFSVATAAQRIVGIVIEGNVEYGTQIQIESEEAQQTPGDIAVAPDQFDIVFVAQLLRVRRLVADQTQSRNASALLVDGDGRLDFAQVAQIVDELPKLRGAFDIATEKNEAARLHLAEKPGSRPVELFSRHTRDDQLTERIAFHSFAT